ncbi:MAG: hypothetical protein M1837_006401 [Sclerophora amabilis]|nr:MAG: hypothetical protein M1837_006401 [Sclerophora amabilis]
MAEAYFFSSSKTLVEYANDDRQWYNSISPEFGYWLGYRELWLYALRHFPEMTSTPPKKEIGKAKPSVKEPSVELWHGLGKLAVELGFRTPRALELSKEDPNEVAALKFLREIRFHSFAADDPPVQEIRTILSRIKRSDGAKPTPTTTCAERGEPRERRFGRPFEDSQDRDRSFLYLSYMYTDDGPRNNDITSFFVKKNTFRSFLGSEFVDVSLCFLIS